MAGLLSFAFVTARMILITYDSTIWSRKSKRTLQLEKDNPVIKKDKVTGWR
jgi:hypothetical protein